MERFSLTCKVLYNNDLLNKTEEIKNNMRKFQLVNRDKQINSKNTQKFIKYMETPKTIGDKQKSILDLNSLKFFRSNNCFFFSPL